MKVLLADDHPLFLDGLRNLLASRGIDVVGTARDGLEAIQQACALRPDVILMDIQMPHMDGLAALRGIKAELPAIKVVMLTTSAQDDDLFEAIKTGASGYLLKTRESEEFFNLLADLERGEVVLSPGTGRADPPGIRTARDAGRDAGGRPGRQPHPAAEGDSHPRVRGTHLQGGWRPVVPHRTDHQIPHGRDRGTAARKESCGGHPVCPKSGISPVGRGGFPSLVLTVPCLYFDCTRRTSRQLWVGRTIRK